MLIKTFTSAELASLSRAAEANARGRQHQNLHESYADPCQRLFNAIGIESYIRPHRHALDTRSESLVAVRGMFALLAFDDDGAVQEVVRFGTEKYGDDHGMGVGVEVFPGAWHTVIALVPDSVLLELKAGPFDPLAAKELAPWAPEEGATDATRYLQRLRELIMSL